MTDKQGTNLASVNLDEKRLDFERDQFFAEMKLSEQFLQKSLELNYLKLAVVIVLLIMVMLYIMGYFKPQCAQTSVVKKENFVGYPATPEVSLLTNSIFRSDAAFDNVI